MRQPEEDKQEILDHSHIPTNTATGGDSLSKEEILDMSKFQERLFTTTQILESHTHSVSILEFGVLEEQDLSYSPQPLNSKVVIMRKMLSPILAIEHGDKPILRKVHQGDTPTLVSEVLPTQIITANC